VVFQQYQTSGIVEFIDEKLSFTLLFIVYSTKSTTFSPFSLFDAHVHRYVIQSSSEVMLQVAPVVTMLVRTLSVETQFPINAILRWGRLFQIIYFDQETSHTYKKSTKNMS
jgi:hypothetical protein